MAKYAQGTSVPVEKTKGEIETLVTKYGATGFISGWNGTQAVVSFEMRTIRVKFVLTLPSITDKSVTHTASGQRRAPGDQQRVLAQQQRERWRAFLLVIKAKLEAVASGIRTFEQEFLHDIVTVSGLTIGETVLPQLESIIDTGKMPPLLPGPSR